MVSALVENLILVALKALEDKEPPREFRIFPYGEISTEKGNFVFTPEACDALLAERARHSAEVQIDYDHLAIKSEKPGDGKAAGWCNLEKRDDGLWAVNVRWTPAAAEMLRNGEYRYFSPYFGATKDKGLIVMLMNIAITNLPAMHQIEALVAASRLRELGLSGAPENSSAQVEVKKPGTAGETPKTRPPPGTTNPKKAKENTMAGHKLGGYLAKHMKDGGHSVGAMAQKCGLSEDRMRSLLDGDAPTPEEMSALATKTFGLKTKDELEEQLSAFDGQDTADDEPEERRVDAGGAPGINPSSASRRKKPMDGDLAASLLIGLTGEENLDRAAEKLASTVKVAASVPAIQEELKSMRKDREREARERLIRRGKEQGKLTPALIRRMASMSAEDAETLLDALPVLTVEQRDLKDAEPSAAAAALTPEELEVCRLTNVPVEKMAHFVSASRSGNNEQAILATYRVGNEF